MQRTSIKNLRKRQQARAEAAAAAAAAAKAEGQQQQQQRPPSQQWQQPLGHHQPAHTTTTTSVAGSGGAGDTSDLTYYTTTTSRSGIPQNHVLDGNRQGTSVNYQMNNILATGTGRAAVNGYEQSSNLLTKGSTVNPVTDGTMSPPAPVSEQLQIVKMISDKLATGLNDDALGAILDLLQQDATSPDAIVSVVTSLSQTASAATTTAPRR